MRKRINLTLAPDSNATLDRLAAETGHSKSAVMDLAIAAYAERRPQIYIRDCMPMIADIVSGSCPRPIALPDGGAVNWHVKNENGEDVPWVSVAPAWHKLNLGDISNACIVARQNRAIDDTVCKDVSDTVEYLREFISERGAAICIRGRILVFNQDGTRVAISERI